MDNKRLKIKKEKGLRIKDPFGIWEFSINIEGIKIKDKWIVPLLIFSILFLIFVIMMLIYTIKNKFFGN